MQDAGDEAPPGAHQKVGEKQRGEISIDAAEHRGRHQRSDDTALYHLFWSFVLSPWEGVFLILIFLQNNFRPGRCLQETSYLRSGRFHCQRCMLYGDTSPSLVESVFERACRSLVTLSFHLLQERFLFF